MMMMRLTALQRRVALPTAWSAMRSGAFSTIADSAVAATSAPTKRPHVGVAVTVLRQLPQAPVAAAPAAPAAPAAEADAAGVAAKKARPPPVEFEVLLVRRSKAPLEGWWALPGGSIELGETVQHAGVREVMEEASLAVTFRQEPEPFFVTQFIDPPNDGAQHAGSQGHFVLVHMMADWPMARARGAGLEQQARAGSDAAEVRWFPAGRLTDMVREQQLEMFTAKKRANAAAAAAAAAAKQKAEEEAAAAAAGIGAEATDAPVAAAPAAEPTPESTAVEPVVVPAAGEVRIIPVVARVVREALRRRRAMIAEAEAEVRSQQQSARRTGQYVANQGLQGKPKPKGPWSHNKGPQQSRDGFNQRRERTPRTQ